MIPAVNTAGYAAKTVQSVTHSSAARVAQTAGPETARASTGESPAANVTLHSAKAVTAPEQAAVAPRLRDQETAEQTDRAPVSKDAPTGPPPTFEESPLERQARVAFDPPEAPVEPAFDLRPDVQVEDADRPIAEDEADLKALDAPPDPPPTPTARAEASFAETKTLATPRDQTIVDVAH